MQVEFDTTEYQFSHGKQPRGRGGWIFEVARASSDTVPHQNTVAVYEQAARNVGMSTIRVSGECVQLWTQSMTYGDAKRVVRDVLKTAFPSVKFSRVVVCS